MTRRHGIARARAISSKVLICTKAMAGSRKPGPLCGFSDPVQIETGTLCRTQPRLPGPIGLATGNDGANPIWAASRLSETTFSAQTRLIEMSLTAIRRETGCELGQALRDRILVLSRLLERFNTATASGAASSRRFAKPSPGRRMGGLRDLFASLGLDFLSASNIGSSEIAAAWTLGASQTATSWRAMDQEPDRTAGLALAIGVLMRLILQGIVDYVRKGGSTASGEAAGPLVERLRSSQLGDAFATWVSKNWKELLKNLRFQPVTDGRAGGGSSKPQSVVSQPRPPVSQAPTNSTATDPPTFPSDINMSAQAATLIAAAAQGAPFCPI